LKRWLYLLLFRRGGWASDVLLALVYLGVLLYAGMVPLRELPAPNFVPADKLWHLMAFGGLGLLLFRAIHHFGVAVPRANSAAALAATGFGALLECLQATTKYRAAELADLIADALGALLTLIFISVSWKYRWSAHA
jgi:VanZ family protein